MSDKRKLGLVMPRAASQLSPDERALFPHVEFLLRGTGVTSLTPDGYDAGVDNILPTAVALKDAGAEAIMVFGTSLSFYRGAAFNADLTNRLQEATGLPASTMSTAIIEGLRAFGARRIVVCTAYGDVVNQRLRAYLAECDIDVLAIDGMGIEQGGLVSQVGSEAIIAGVDGVFAQAPDADAILISCGGLRTLSVTSVLEEKFGVPVVSSAPAALWQGVRLLGDKPKIDGYGRLLALD